MKTTTNKGFDPKTISAFSARLEKAGRSYLLDKNDENSDEYAHFYFVGRYEDQPVIYDAVIYTLRLQHESELFEIAEHRAAQHFPHYKKISYHEDDEGNMSALDSEEEEIGLFMAEVIMELEEEDHVKVKEHLEVDPLIDFGVGLEAGLHLETITPKAIESFIRDFNARKLALDDTLYSFQTEGQA